MKIKTKILCTLLAMSLLVALVGGAGGLSRQRASVTTAATKEAENVARVLGFALMSHTNQFRASAQEMLTRLHETQGRDVVLMDSHKLIIADANLPSVGEIYTKDQHDEVAATIRDGKARTFVEISSDNPVGVKQLVVPVKSNSGQTFGAVILEYTPLYDELMQSTKTTTRQVILAGFGGVIIALLIAFYMGRSIAVPLEQLTSVATGFASGKTDLPMPPPRMDEIGELATAFNNMVQKRQQTEKELRYARDNMEVRVEERTKELDEVQSLYYSLVDQMPAGVFRKDVEGRFVFVNAWYCRLKGMTPDQILGKTPQELAAGELANHPEAAKEIKLAIQGTNNHEWIMKTGRRIDVEEQYRGADGQMQYWQVVKSPVFDSDGKITGTQALFFDITASKNAEAELAYERDLLRALLDNSPDPIYFKDVQSRFIKVSNVQIRSFGLKDPHELLGRTDFDFFAEDHARPAFEDEQEIIRTGVSLIGKVEKETLKDGRVTWALTSKMPLRNKDGQIVGTFGISKNITAIKEAEAKLEQAHKQLLETSRLAGMAEIATNVLHNVGNVLNSVNVSASVVIDSVKKSKAASLAKVAALLREHEKDLGTFFTGDPRGRQLPAYLAQLSEHLLADQKVTVKELDLLVKNIEHIMDIVTMQQTYAKVSGVKEIVNLRELVEDGLRMNAGALGQHGVEVVREFADVPPVNLDKHKVLQVLVNLIRNAKHACQDSERADKRLTIHLADGSGRIKISVGDNGVGIPPENLLRIFNHGFTTRKDGHGFGLHSGALAAKEMGGTLTAHSDGAGQGATFTLELPCDTNGGAHE